MFWDREILKQLCCDHSFGKYTTSIIDIFNINETIDTFGRSMINYSVVEKTAISQDIYRVSYPFEEYYWHVRKNRDKKLDILLCDLK